MEMRCYVHGATTVTTGCYEEDGIGDPEVLVAPDALLRCWIDCSGGFFRELICWLEAIAVGVRECAFPWDCEGLEGELRWRRDSSGSGRLEYRWSGGHGTVAFEHGARLSRHQLVQAIYGAFVGFLESRDGVQNSTPDEVGMAWPRLTIRP